MDIIGSIILLLCLGALAPIWTAKNDRIRAISLVALGVALVGFLGWMAMLSWAFKDGMGSDSMPSHGAMAIGRFAEDFWPMAALASLVAGMGVAGNRLGRKRNQREQD